MVLRTYNIFNNLLLASNISRKITGHKIDFDNTEWLGIMEHETRRIIRKAIKIDKATNNLNRGDETHRLPTAWKQAFNRISQSKQLKEKHDKN